MAKYAKQEVSESLEVLRAALHPGTTVYTVLRHCSASGMSRRISVFTLDASGPSCWDYHVARVLGLSLDRRGAGDGVKVTGCGMDMGFHLINSLSYALHGMETVGAPAKRAGAEGRPFTPQADTYRAGYSLTQHWL